MHVCLYTYIYIYIYTYVYVYIHIVMYTCLHMHVYDPLVRLIVDLVIDQRRRLDVVVAERGRDEALCCVL